ncbi:MAG: hypothetical protein A2X47_11010 [Lentisphaerae bacterium GWF2_38_69]|nr:MAG: hypothetical protein A2X47_11010 [Lentisphaerae bacterium GWF2_38_69]
MRFIIFALSAFILTSLSAAPTILEVEYKDVTVDGKTVKVATIEQPDGTWGYYGEKGGEFDVIVKNKLDTPTVIHWHGLILPDSQDGVSGVTQLNPIDLGKEYHYKFKLVQSGTYWMHSHYGMQEQELVEAPFIITTADDKDYKQVVVMFQDFSFKSPSENLKELQSQSPKDDTMKIDNKAMPGMAMNKEEAAPDLNDVKYDAFLTNYHTDDNPEVVKVKPEEKVKLRFIDGSAATNYWVTLGGLKGQLIAVDGQSVKPIEVEKIQLALGQRADVIVTIPKEGGTYQILGQVEGLKAQTGIILTAEAKAEGFKIETEASEATPALNYDQDFLLHSLDKLLPELSTDTVRVKLSGDMDKYIWKINDQVWPDITPIKVKQNQRIVMIIDNETMMSHPMHLHGYDFKITNINGKSVDGPFRDTVLVQPMSTVIIQFDAINAGKWMFHCHNIYHMAAGMMTYIDVIGVKEN